MKEFNIEDFNIIPAHCASRCDEKKAHVTIFRKSRKPGLYQIQRKPHQISDLADVL